MALISLRTDSIVSGMTACFNLTPQETTLLSRAMKAFEGQESALAQLMQTCKNSLEVYSAIGHRVTYLRAQKEVAAESHKQALEGLSHTQSQKENVSKKSRERREEHDATVEKIAADIQSAALRCAEKQHMTFMKVKNPFFHSQLARGAVSVGCHAGIILAAATLHHHRQFLSRECAEGAFSCANAFLDNSVIYPIATGFAVQSVAGYLSSGIQTMLQAQLELNNLNTKKAHLQQAFESDQQTDDHTLQQLTDQEKNLVSAMQQAQDDTQQLDVQQSQLCEQLAQQCLASGREIVNSQLDILKTVSSFDEASASKIQRSVVTTLCHTVMLGEGIAKLVHSAGGQATLSPPPSAAAITD